MDFLLPEYDKLAHHPREPRVKKILALLVPQDKPQVFEEARQLLEKEWGAPERISPRIPFVWTNYYEDISPKLDRIFFSYPSLHHFTDLASWKRLTVEIEKKTGVTRRVNLDPGTIDGARLVLASTKGQAHRVYLSRGIFCEVTLCRRKGHWESFFYTFPDFKSGAYDEFLETVRQDWKKETDKSKN